MSAHSRLALETAASLCPAEERNGQSTDVEDYLIGCWVQVRLGACHSSLALIWEKFRLFRTNLMHADLNFVFCSHLGRLRDLSNASELCFSSESRCQAHFRSSGVLFWVTNLRALSESPVTVLPMVSWKVFPQYLLIVLVRRLLLAKVLVSSVCTSREEDHSSRSFSQSGMHCSHASRALNKH